MAYAWPQYPAVRGGHGPGPTPWLWATPKALDSGKQGLLYSGGWSWWSWRFPRAFRARPGEPRQSAVVVSPKKPGNTVGLVGYGGFGRGRAIEAAGRRRLGRRGPGLPVLVGEAGTPSGPGSLIDHAGIVEMRPGPVRARAGGQGPS